MCCGFWQRCGFVLFFPFQSIMTNSLLPSVLIFPPYPGLTHWLADDLTPLACWIAFCFICPSMNGAPVSPHLFLIEHLVCDFHLAWTLLCSSCVNSCPLLPHLSQRFPFGALRLFFLTYQGGKLGYTLVWFGDRLWRYETQFQPWFSLSIVSLSFLQSRHEIEHK